MDSQKAMYFPNRKTTKQIVQSHLLCLAAVRSYDWLNFLLNLLYLLPSLSTLDPMDPPIKELAVLRAIDHSPTTLEINTFIYLNRVLDTKSKVPYINLPCTPVNCRQPCRIWRTSPRWYCWLGR